MEISGKRQGSAVVLDIEGSLTAEVDTVRLHELAGSLVRPGASSLVLDLRHVPNLDSYGVGQLVSLYNEVTPLGISLTLVNVERHQRRLLELAGLLSLLHVVDSRQEALESGGSVPAPLIH
jgi:stage II sporulation protein AA (anti-sigma F factor antagonist)